MRGEKGVYVRVFGASTHIFVFSYMAYEINSLFRSLIIADIIDIEAPDPLVLAPAADASLGGAGALIVTVAPPGGTIAPESPGPGTGFVREPA